VESLIKKYFKINKPTEITKHISANKNLQKSFLLMRSIKVIEMKFLSGDIITATLLKSKFDITADGQTLIMEEIPKDIASHANEIKFLTPHTVLEADPLIVYDTANVDSIIYYVKKEVDPEQTKKIGSVIIDPFLTSDEKGFSMTGFAIFSSLSDMENPALVIQIAVIVLLLLVYVLYEFEILTKMQKYDIIKKLNPLTYVPGLINKDMKEIQKLIKQASEEINKEELTKAEDTYHKLIKIYNDKLSSDLRKKTIDKISSIYNELLVHRIIKKVKQIEHSVESGDKSKAKEYYNKMQELYKQLPKSWKSRVSSDCKKAFGLLAK
jgi:hypothetical protein